MTAVLTGLALDSIPRAFAQQLRKHDPARDFEVSPEAKQSPVFYFKRETFHPCHGVFAERRRELVEATRVSVRTDPSAASAHNESRALRSFALVSRAGGS